VIGVGAWLSGCMLGRRADDRKVFWTDRDCVGRQVFFVGCGVHHHVAPGRKRRRARDTDVVSGASNNAASDSKQAGAAPHAATYGGSKA
jgi:hypothetical protein